MHFPQKWSLFMLKLALRPCIRGQHHNFGSNYLELCVTEAFLSDEISLRRWQHEDLLSNTITARKCNLTLRIENFRRSFKSNLMVNDLAVFDALPSI